jgi:hypothetical protein
LLRPAAESGRLKNLEKENPMNDLYSTGFDVHKKTVSYCRKTARGKIMEEGVLAARRQELRKWAAAQPQPWWGAMEATLFSAWIYDTLKA